MKQAESRITVSGAIARKRWGLGGMVVEGWALALMPRGSEVMGVGGFDAA